MILLHRRAWSALLWWTALSLVSTNAYSQMLTVLHTFNGLDGESPAGYLLRDAAGNLYGTASYGAAGFGTIFKLDPAGNYTVLYTFLGSPNDGAYPNGPLLWDKKAHFYGTTTRGGTADYGTVFRLGANGKESIIHNFGSTASDGQWPYAGLVRDSAGNIYGTTSYGGRYNGGNVFEIESAGKQKVLFDLDGMNYGAAGPGGGTLLIANGKLVGTAGGGGFNLGTVYTLSPLGETTLLNFNNELGEFPFAGLIKDASGNFYGTTMFGGDLTCNAPSSGCGVVFKLDAQGNETVLYSFLGIPDGDDPTAGLTIDKAGNLFGTTKYGGTGPCQNQANGCGTIFEISPTGAETVLYNFTGGSDGAYPVGGLTLDAQGNLYGATSVAGSSECYGQGCGTIFKLTP